MSHLLKVTVNRYAKALVKKLLLRTDGSGTGGLYNPEPIRAREFGLN